MLGIALNFGRSPHVALDQDTHANTAERGGGGKVLRLTGDDVFGGSDLGDYFFAGLNRTARKPAQCQRCTHEFEKIPPTYRILQLGSLLGELALDHGGEFFGLGQLVQAAPVLLALGGFEAGADGREIDVFSGFHVSGGR